MRRKLFRPPIKLEIFDDHCILLSKIVERAQTSNPAVHERRGETWLLSVTSNSTWTWLAILIPPQKPVIFFFVDCHWSQRWADASCCQDTPEANGANIVPPRSAGNQRGQRMAIHFIDLYRCHPKGMFHMHTHAMQRDTVELLFAEDKVECVVCVTCAAGCTLDFLLLGRLDASAIFS